MLKLLFQHVDIFYKYRSFFCLRNTRSEAWFTPLDHFTLRSMKNSYHLNNTLKYLSSKLLPDDLNGSNASPIAPQNENFVNLPG